MKRIVIALCMVFAFATVSMAQQAQPTTPPAAAQKKAPACKKAQADKKAAKPKTQAAPTAAAPAK